MIGKALKYLRIKKGLSQEQLGKITNIGRSTISDYEREKTDINYSNLEKIANNCGYKIMFVSDDNKEKWQIKDLKRKDV